MRVWGNEMFGTSWRKCSAKVVRKFLGRFPSHVALLTFHQILVPPPDSLHGSGGVRSCSGPQSRWVSHTLLCFPPFSYLCCYLEKCMHKILLGRHSCGYNTVNYCSSHNTKLWKLNIENNVNNELFGFIHVVSNIQFDCHSFSNHWSNDKFFWGLVDLQHCIRFRYTSKSVLCIFFKLFSIICYYKIQNMVPCAKSLLFIFFNFFHV